MGHARSSEPTHIGPPRYHFPDPNFNPINTNTNPNTNPKPNLNPNRDPIH